VKLEFIVFPGPEVPAAGDSPGTATYTGGSLPWPNLLTEPVGGSGVVRTESKAVVVVLGCIAQKTPEGSPPFGDGDGDTPQFLATPTVCFTTPGNKQEPKDEKGINLGNNQSKLNFDKESGKLLCKGPGEKEGEEITFEGTTSQTLKVMGYKGSEIIIAK
jgi:hypothetical protein